jgi:hypothetical protein
VNFLKIIGFLVKEFIKLNFIISKNYFTKLLILIKFKFIVTIPKVFSHQFFPFKK